MHLWLSVQITMVAMSMDGQHHLHPSMFHDLIIVVESTVGVA
jgi:hypothetical protein